MKRAKRNGWLMLLTVIILASCWGLKAKAASNFIYDSDSICDGTVNVSYSAAITYHACEDKIKTAAVSSGTLPPGLSYSVNKNTNSVEIKGVPTSSGTYSFKITATSENGKTVTSSQYKIQICLAWQTFTVSMKGCTAKHEDGTQDTLFRAGEKVTLVPTDLAKTDFVYNWKNDAGLNIQTDNIIDKGTWSKNTFKMPAKNISIECQRKNKDLGTLEHYPLPNTGADETCSRIPVKSMDLAVTLGVVGLVGLIKEGYKLDETSHNMFWYYDIDLDKDGTVDLVLMDNYSFRSGVGYGGEVCYMKAEEGRSAYGKWTVEIPKSEIYARSEYGLYSKIVFDMGTKPGGSSGDSGSSGSSSTGHKCHAVQAKAPDCESDGWTWHCECSHCDDWFWDLEGKYKIADKNSVIQKATGHKWSAWTVVKEATETQDGLKERRCYNNKNHVQQEVIPATGPKPTEPPTTEAPPETTAEPTTEAPTTEAPTTEAPPETTAEPTTETPTSEAPTTEAPPETTAAPTTEAPPETTAASSTEAPATQAPTQPAEPEKSGSGNGVLYAIIGVLAVGAGVLGGILIGKGKTGKH